MAVARNSLKKHVDWIEHLNVSKLKERVQKTLQKSKLPFAKKKKKKK
jgi:hypothetical protein